MPLKTNTSKLKVCSDHFTLEDYNRNLKAEFLNDLKRTLKDTAYHLTSINEEIVASQSILGPEGNMHNLCLGIYISLV